LKRIIGRTLFSTTVGEHDNFAGGDDSSSGDNSIGVVDNDGDEGSSAGDEDSVDNNDSVGGEDCDEYSWWRLRRLCWHTKILELGTSYQLDCFSLYKHVSGPYNRVCQIYLPRYDGINIDTIMMVNAIVLPGNMFYIMENNQVGKKFVPIPNKKELHLTAHAPTPVGANACGVRAS
jgi:hypothetical protein